MPSLKHVIRSASSLWFRRHEFLIPFLLLSLSVTFNLYHLYPEVAADVQDGNDMVMHLVLTGTAVESITQLLDFTDPWQGTLSTGFPIFHYYQHLPHLSTAFIHILTFGTFSLSGILHWVVYLLLSIFPITVFWSLRLFGFDRISSAMAGVVAPLVATDGLLGFDFRSYVFSGWGIYAQLWGMVLLPPALAVGYRVLREGQGYFWATVLLAATLMSHLIYGYMAFITLGVIIFIQPIRGSTLRSSVEALCRRWCRLIVLFLLVLVVTSYFLVPFFLDLSYFNRTVWADPTRYDSYGHSIVLSRLITGQLFDGFDRIPLLTALVAVGLVICLIRWQKERYLVPVAIFLMWLTLYFGRATWGSLIDLLPMSGDVHMNRFIGGLHLGGIILIGIALAAPLRWAISRTSIWTGWYVNASLILTILMLLPLYSERSSYLERNALSLAESQQRVDAETKDLSALVEELKQLPPGRVYAGLKSPGRRHWSDTYRVGLIRPYDLLQAKDLDMIGHVYHSYSLNSDVLINFDERRWDHYNLYNVRYVVAPEGTEFPTFVQPLEQFGRHVLYQVHTTGYFDLVGSDMKFAGTKTEVFPAATNWLASVQPLVKQHPQVSIGNHSRDVQRLSTISSAVEIIPKDEASLVPSRGLVLSEEVGSNYFEADVTVERASMLLLKSTYHPNWQATVGGVRVETVMLFPSFVGVQLPPGDHQIRLEYRPRRLRLALLVLGLLTLLLILIGEKYGGGCWNWFNVKFVGRISSQFKRLYR